MGRNFRGRKDDNHQIVVEAFERTGCHVIDMSHVGGGFPDLLVWCRGGAHLVEIKNRTNSYGRNGANKLQREWADNWPQPVWVITSLEDVERFVNGRLKELKWYGRPGLVVHGMNEPACR